MWLVVVILTAILWLLLDNILIAAILAVFAVYSYTLVRALYRVKQEETSPTSSVDKTEVVSLSTEDRNEEKNEVASEDVDTSYIDFVQDNYKK
ncbi:MAG: hypothetical protein SOX43_08435 [Pelistega sp.]|nr:hypothetical protein [Pelistega sp.]